MTCPNSASGSGLTISDGTTLGFAVEAPLRIRAASALSGFGEVSAGSRLVCSAMCEAGANAIVPRSFSPGAHCFA